MKGIGMLIEEKWILSAVLGIYTDLYYKIPGLLIAIYGLLYMAIPT
jgi:hypothetical protein